jgi:heme/copper-type cytochrome/quinol oxidase subunit 2
MGFAPKERRNALWRWLRRPREIGLALLGLAILFMPLPVGAAAPIDRHFRIEARSFAFTPSVLTVNPGDQVTIDLVAMDVVHGLSIDGYNLSVTADPGQTAHLTFVADRVGTFRFRCAIACGALHPFMLGKLVVGQNGLGWRAAALLALAVVAGLGWRRP